MDVLTDWLHLTGTKGALLARNHLRAPWGMKLGPSHYPTFHLISSGTCWLVRDGAQPLALAQGDIVVLAHGSAHALVDDPATVPVSLDVLTATPPRSTGAATIVVCSEYRSELALAPSILKALPPLVHLTRATISAFSPLQKTVDMLIEELAQPAAGADRLVRSLFDALFVYVLRIWITTATCSPGWLSGLSDKAVGIALGSMHERPHHDWTVASLARVAGLSRAAFARRFTERVGEPPMEYLTGWRMQMAARMLVDEDLALREVAQRVGYASEFAFSRAFKRARGVAPTVFKRTTLSAMRAQ